MDLLQALADPTRRAILTSLQAAGRALTVDEVAAIQGVHRTVAFEHLEVLAGLGLLERDARTGFRGRPARLYRAPAAAVEISYPARQYRLLALVLADALAEQTEPSRAGEAFGRRLAAGSRDQGEAIAALEQLGSRYELRGEEIHAGNCIFREACDSAREIVCGVHAGLLQGALAAAGLDRQVIPKGPEPGRGCAYHVQQAANPAEV